MNASPAPGSSRPDDGNAHRGLCSREILAIKNGLGRQPSRVELGIFSALWNEHCSYKSSREHLRRLPQHGPRVLHGPGENAGVVDIGEGLAVVFKMESHNHPSCIAPFQGAATGVGGILRDIFTMGARPVACLDALSIGDCGIFHNRNLLREIVAGISHYGNSFGVPVMGGELRFHACYDANPLVNVMAVGIARQERIFTGSPQGANLPVVYVGSPTGLDGIHGATMASSNFGNDVQSARPAVQIGDPFAQHRLCEACLELMATDAIEAIQDMGAAGLTCASVEMAQRGGLGIALDLDGVPLRSRSMGPYEIMLSESQERMLMILRPGTEACAREIFRRWDVPIATVGVTTNSGALQVVSAGETVADIPLALVASGQPTPHRPMAPPPPPPRMSHNGAGGRASHRCLKSIDSKTVVSAVQALLGGKTHACKRWVHSQFDVLIRGETCVPPGGDAAVVGVPGTKRALAMTTDVNPRYCQANPHRGACQAVAEAWRNLVAVGAQPLAVTDNLNFGDPTDSRVMGAFSATIDGIREASLALDCPVVSGNVSFYNQTGSRAIWPTPTIGMLGIVADADTICRHALKGNGSLLVLVGPPGTHLGQSDFLVEWLGGEGGEPPAVDLQLERRVGTFVRTAIAARRLLSVHDVSSGGLAVCVAEMALAGNVGVEVSMPLGERESPAWWFGEDQARYVCEIRMQDLDGLRDLAADAKVPFTVIGRTGGDAFRIDSGACFEELSENDGAVAVPLDELREKHDNWLPRLMEEAKFATTAPASS